VLFNDGESEFVAGSMGEMDVVIVVVMAGSLEFSCVLPGWLI
jgi:hypothetical protein